MAADNLSTIHRIVQTLSTLMPRSQNGWVPFTLLAREVFGAPTYDEIVKGYVALPEAQALFRTSTHTVTLTEEGLRLIQRGMPTSSPVTPHENRLREAIQAVRQYAGRLRAQRITVRQVLALARTTGRHVYAVEVEIEDQAVPIDAPITLYFRDGTAPVRGRIVGQEPDGVVLYIAFDSRVTTPPGSQPFLLVDRSFLLAQLADALERLPGLPERGRALWRQNRKDLAIGDPDSITVAQALLKLPTPWTRFLWGPPGAGKTFGLGYLIRSLLEAEPSVRVLLVAPANLAVDVATMHLVRQLEASPQVSLLKQRQILRFGYPRKADILERPELLGPANLDQRTRHIKQLSERVAQAERERATDGALAVLRAELLEAQELLKHEVEEHVAQCRVVATTTTLAYLPRSPISRGRWNTVLIDEVTMVPPAVCIFLSSLAEERLLLAGDPQQLGPVYEERLGATDSDGTREFMGRDIFEASALAWPRGHRREIELMDPRLTRIMSQRRCPTQIWSKVESLYPMVENRVEAERPAFLCTLPPLRGEEMVLLDTGAFRPAAQCHSQHQSWINRYTAELALEVASSITTEVPTKAVTVAIITPYRAQVALLRKWLREEIRAGSTIFHGVEVGTVHQFQGSEADVVIFDLVDGRGRDRVGRLLQGDMGLRLVNVALTRARGKFILIADRRWFISNERHQHDNPLLWQLIKGTTVSRGATVLAVAPPEDELASQVESPIELLLLRAMQQLPSLARVVPQYRILDEHGRLVSRADFAFPDEKLAVYCDGAQWHLRPDRWQRDLRQRNRLQMLGWRFNAFSGHDVQQNAAGCAQQVAQTLQSLNTPVMSAAFAQPPLPDAPILKQENILPSSQLPPQVSPPVSSSAPSPTFETREEAIQHLTAYVTALIARSPQRKAKLEASLQWQLKSLDNHVTTSQKRGQTLRRALELWVEQACRAADAKVR